MPATPAGHAVKVETARQSSGDCGFGIATHAQTHGPRCFGRQKRNRKSNEHDTKEEQQGQPAALSR